MNETKVLNEIPKIKNVAQRTQTYNELFWDSDDENMDEIVKFILNEIPHDKSKNLMTSICKTLLRSYDWQSKLNLELLKNILPQADYDLKLQILKTYKEQDYELEFTAESSRVILDQLIELPLKEDNQYRITSTINLISDLIDDDLEFHQILLGLTERFRRYEIITYTIHANVDKLTLNEDIVKQYWINEYKSHNSNSILHDICFFMRKKNIEVDLRIACSKFRKAIDRRKHPARYSQSRFEYGISEISYILEIFSSKDSQKEVLQTINWLFENGPEFLTRYEANRLIELNLMNHAQLERLKRILDLRIINQGKFYYEEEKKLMSENKHYIT